MTKPPEPTIGRCPVCDEPGETLAHDSADVDVAFIGCSDPSCPLADGLPPDVWDRLSVAAQLLDDLEAYQGHLLITSSEVFSVLNQGVLYGLGLEEEAQYCQDKIRDYMAQSRAPQTTDDIRTYHDALCFHYGQLRMRLLNHLNAGKGT